MVMKKRIYLRAKPDPNAPTDEKPKKEIIEKSKGYAFAFISDIAVANEIIKKLNGTEVNGRPIKLDLAVKKPIAEKEAAPVKAKVTAVVGEGGEAKGETKSIKKKKPKKTYPTENLVHISNLPFTTSDSALKSFVEGLVGGLVKLEVRIVRSRPGKKFIAEQVEKGVDKDTIIGRSKGYGFIEVGSIDEVDKVVKTLDGKEMEGRALKVKVSVPKDQVEQ
jgi:RNA recognition motif-containing protein